MATWQGTFHACFGGLFFDFPLLSTTTNFLVFLVAGRALLHMKCFFCSLLLKTSCIPGRRHLLKLHSFYFFLLSFSSDLETALIWPSCSFNYLGHKFPRVYLFSGKKLYFTLISILTFVLCIKIVLNPYRENIIYALFVWT